MTIRQRRRGDLHLRADALWEEGLVLVYRLLFILKLESASNPACAFSFASTNLWRGALSPNRALGPLVRRFLDQGHDTGRMLEDGLRTVFRAFRDGLSCSELSVAPLGGALFGAQATPLLERLAWGERAVALLLDRLLWTTPKGRARERVTMVRWMSRNSVASMRRCWSSTRYHDRTDGAPAACEARGGGAGQACRSVRGGGGRSRDAGDLGRGHSDRPVLPACRRWPQGDRFLLHAACVRSVPGAETLAPKMRSAVRMPTQTLPPFWR